ncbi:uncharacterized protein EV420DRAFT_1488925 [Desarmillaria tabescens]|uniref:Uncharacterized protein n=1 Tax=Armillaria tabescens TaxID=1929756 RepID=A0AA39J3R1_ARMTA|nr:uncharacterized protein EV420DRAFT_1488925 [Desarmillaria tabescens]KAK0433828.1 hypothetical protein EV420DRAFT_1488925 [Desarmillaria tabescens]
MYKWIFIEISKAVGVPARPVTDLQQGDVCRHVDVGERVGMVWHEHEHRDGERSVGVMVVMAASTIFHPLCTFMDRTPQEVKNKIIAYTCNNVVDAHNCALVDKSFLWQAREYLFGVVDIAGSHRNFIPQTALLIDIAAHKLHQLPNVLYHIRAVTFHGISLDDRNTFLLYIITSISDLTKARASGSILSETRFLSCLDTKSQLSTEAELSFEGLNHLTNLSFSGAMSALQFLHRSIDTLTQSNLDRYSASTQYFVVVSSVPTGTLEKLDESLLLQRAHAIGDVDRDSFKEDTFPKFHTCGSEKVYFRVLRS